MEADKTENVHAINMTAVSNIVTNACIHTITLLLHTEAHNTACLSAFIQKKEHKIIGSTLATRQKLGTLGLKQRCGKNICPYLSMLILLKFLAYEKDLCHSKLLCCCIIDGKSSFNRYCESVISSSGFSAE